MAASSATFITMLEAESLQTPEERGLLPVLRPLKVVYSAAQNPLRSITPGYRETDIQLLTMEAGRPSLHRSPSIEEEKDFILNEPDRREKRCEIYRQIAVSYSALTLYLPFKSRLIHFSGLNDGAPGALLPYLERYYHVNYAIVSLIFLSNACGFIFSSFLSNRLHIMVGRCKSLIIGSGLQVVSYLIYSTHPSYGIIIVGFFLAGAGMGFLLAHCNSYMVHILA